MTNPHPHPAVRVILPPLHQGGEPRPPLSPTAVLNYGAPLHDWYLMPEAYSATLVSAAIRRFHLGPGDTLLDPFSGTGTTVATAVLHGVNGVGLEINPFLAFAAQVKLDWQIDLAAFVMARARLLAAAEPLLSSLAVEPTLFTAQLPPEVAAAATQLLQWLDTPTMPRIYEWMAPVVVRKLLLLRHLIDENVPERLRPHFLLAFAAILRPVSNMKLTAHAFGSQVQKTDAPVFELFAQKLAKIEHDLAGLQALAGPLGAGRIVCCDARTAGTLADPLLPAALAVTSPPYLNNLDYTMQTRMELFFLRFIADMGALRDLRKAMLISDAKAMYKDVKDHQEVAHIASIQAIAERLREVHAGKNWGWDYSFMTRQYFGGMLRVLRAVRPLLCDGAHLLLIVGESAHSGVKVPVPELLAELGAEAGYECREITVIRRRRSSSHKHELCESEVDLQKI
jgi:hypothetical protein